MSVAPANATISVAGGDTSASAVVAIGTLGTDATYAYYVSYSATNSSGATMTNCGTCVAQTASQTVLLTGLTANTTYYFWVRAKNTSTLAYTVISPSSGITTVTPPSGTITLSVNTITQLTCNAAVTMTTLGTAANYDYFISSAATNSTAASMTDLVLLLAQTTSQTPALSGLSPNTTQYLFVRAYNVKSGIYIVLSTTGTTLTTTAGVAASGGTVGTPSSVTSISATVAVTLTTLGTDSLYNYFLSSSPTNSTGGTMTDRKVLNAQTTSQNVSLTLLAPSTTSYLFARAQNIKTGAYSFMTITGTTLTTLGTGSAPTGSTVSVTSKASTTAVIAVTMTTLGTNANYVYYLSWCATNSVGGTMVNGCLLAAQTASQTVYPSGLPAGTSPYLFVRAKNVLTGAYTVMSASGTVVSSLSAASLYYESAALTAFDPTSSSSFGFSVSVSGSYAVVGAYDKFPLGVVDLGGAYVLELNGTTGEWEHTAVLYSTDASQYAPGYFGYSVAVSGTYAVVGSYASPGGKQNAGAVYVFERNSGTSTWEQKARLFASDALPFDNLGRIVSVSGTYLIAGCHPRKRLGIAYSGGAYVFERNSGTSVWEQKASLFPSDFATGSQFGYSVSVSGTYAIVGAILKSGNVGGAYVYERNSGTGAWEEKAILADASALFFGYSVSIDGTYAVVGASNKTVNSITLTGGAYVYERVSGTWTQTAVLDNPDPVSNDQFGCSVAVNGVYAAVGCNLKDPASKNNAGTTYLYRRNSTTGVWENKIEWAASDGLASDQMGCCVSISGTHVFSGAYGKNVNAVGTWTGGAYVYELPSSGVVAPAATIYVAGGDTSTVATVTIGTLGTDATYTYVVSRSTTNSSAAAMTDCGTCVAQTASQAVTITGLTANTTYYFWVRSKIASLYTISTVISSSSGITTVTPPSGTATLSVNTITQLTCNAAVTMTTLGTAANYNYFISSATTNSTAAAMTDVSPLLAQTTSQTPALSGLTPNTTQYLFVRAQNAKSGLYVVLSTTGTTLTTTAGVAPAGGTVGTPSSVTSISATVAVTMTTMGTDSVYNYFLSSSPTNSTGDTMTNLVSLTAQTASQNASLTLLAPSTTSYLFARAQNVNTGAYIFMTTVGVTLTTLGTGSAPTGSTVSVTSAASTTAVVAVTMTTLGTNANYAYYLSWCATNSVGGSMGNTCLLAAQTSSQTVYPSGLPAGTSPYLFVRAKNVLTGTYTVMSASGTQIAMSAASLYYESAALTAFDPVASDSFGYKVAVSGSYAVVGSYRKDPLAMLSAGGAYVLELNGTTGEWEHKAVLYPTDAYPGDFFGVSVSVSSTYAVIGASASDPGGKTNAGAAYVFERNSGTSAWEQKTKLVAGDAMPGDAFGVSVCVSGAYVVAGAYGRTASGGVNSGGAYIFERNSGTGVWEQKAFVFPSDLPSASRFGYSVSVSGTYAIVGAEQKTGGGGAYIYERNSSTGAWAETAILTCSDSTSATFGRVSIDGTYAVVSGYSKTVNSVSGAGSVYVYERGASAWPSTPTAILDNPDPVASDNMGTVLEVRGVYLAVGCWLKNPASKISAGSTYLYKRNSNTGTWENKIEWTSSDGLAGDQMGTSVAIGSTHVFSGAIGKSVTGNTNAGGAYVYELPSSSVAPSGVTISAPSAMASTDTATVTIATLGTDANYTYVVSYSTTNSASAAMTDCGTVVAQTSPQNVILTGLFSSTTYYLWVRSSISSLYTIYTVISSSAAITTTATWLPVGGTIVVSAITQLTCTATVTITNLGGSGLYDYFLSSSPTNSTSGTMTDLIGMLRQTTSQALSVSGLSANTTQYLFLRSRSVADGSYAFITTTGVVLTTSAGVAPSGGTVGTPSSVTSISATVAVTMTTLGTDSTYNYFLSSSPTNSTGGTMTNLLSLTAQTASQNANLTLLTPSTTRYLFCRAQNVVTGAYIFMTTVGTTLTTLGTGSTPAGSTVSVTSAASTTAVVNVTMTTLGTNANYVYYLSWCATNSVGGTMANVCLLASQTASQTVYPSGLPAGTSPYLFVRAKNVLTGTYTVTSASGTAITLSASSIYYEAAALTAFDPVASDNFGRSVAVSGGYAVVGAYAKDPLSIFGAGGAYVLELSGTTGEWEHKAVLYPTDAYASDGFGLSVAVSGTYAVVGASASDAGGKSDAGAAYVFERNSGTGAWASATKLVASDAMPGDMFGYSVGVSGTYAIVGAYARKKLGAVSSGGAYVFERNSGTAVWEQKAVMYPSDLPTGTRFGFSVSVSGTYAIVGAYNKSGGGGAYVYERNSSTGAWEEKAILAMSDTTTGNFGYSVSIDGTYAIVNAYAKTVSSVAGAGGAYVFERLGITWTQTAILDNPDPVASDFFGISVAVNGVYVVIGCYGKDPASKSGAGSTYLYKRNSTTGAWENKVEWAASDGLANDTMGWSVGISGTHVVSGAYNKAVTGVANAGGAYVYELPSDPNSVVPPSATITAPRAVSTTSAATITVGTLGTDATYAYVISYSTTNSATAAMVDCGVCSAQTSPQSVALVGLTAGTTYYLWVRSMVVSSSYYNVVSSSSAMVTAIGTWPPSGGTIVLSSIAQLTCTATVTMVNLGTAGGYDYFLSGSPTNSMAGTMTDWMPMTRQTASQALSVSGLTSGTHQYLFLRSKDVVTGAYAFITTMGVMLDTPSGVAPSGGTVGTPTSVTSISATAAVTLTTLGTDSTYNYFLSSSPTNSTAGTMTNRIALTAQTASQNANLTLLAPSTTLYLFARAQNVVTGAYIFMTTTGVTLTTLGTGSAPTGSTISVTSKASTTAVVNVTMTTLGTNANYVYYLSWCATNSVGGTMGNVCLLAAQTASQTVYPSGLPAGTSPYLFVRAKNVITGAYTVMSATGTIVSALTASSIYYEAAALTAFDPVASDQFGYSVAVSGSYAVVGARLKDPLSITDTGGAYVLELNGSTGEWEHKAVLYPSDAYAADYFGLSVAVSGTYAVVGAYLSDSGGKANAGAAYVFERNSGTGAWNQSTKIVASDAMPSDQFGYCVSVSGTYAIVGAYGRKRMGTAYSGGAYVFERNTGTTVWEQKAVLFPSDLPTGSQFGVSVSVSGTYAIVGAYQKSGGGGAYVYERNSGSGAWEEKAILAMSDTTTGSFGYAVSIDGTYAVVGSYFKTVSSLSAAGGVYVFERAGSTWTQTAILDNPDPVATDYFGASVAVNGVYAVIGCYLKDPAAKTSAGSTYLYKRNSTSGVWENKVEWTASDGLAGDVMGYSVGISGTHVVSGANAKAVTGVASAGGAYVYELPSSGVVAPSTGAITTASVTSAAGAGSATVTIGTLGTDATYTYVVSYSTSNSSAATMVDVGTCVAQTASQGVTLASLPIGSVLYLWVRSKVTSSSAYTALSSAYPLITALSSITLSAITQLTCTATVTMANLGAAGAYNYFLSGSPTNSTGGTMTDLSGMLRQTASQALSISGLSPNTTQYLFLRSQNVATGTYTFLTTTGVTLTTTAGVAAAGGTVGTPSSVTSISATVAVTMTTLGTDSIYNYFLSSSPTNSTGGTMTNLKSLTAQTTAQSVPLTLLAPSTTSYLFCRAQNVKTGAYIFMTTVGVTLTTLGTGSAPTGSTVSVTSATSTTAVVNVTMTTLGTNANYVYYLSWCATNSTGGTMGNVCLLAAQTASQTVYPSGLPAGTSPYLFVRAKNVLTGAYTVMSATGTQITMSAASNYYEATALTAFDPVASDLFGYSVAVSGTYAIVAARYKDPLSISNAGGAYVLELNGSTGEWEHKAVLYPTDAYNADVFGQSVSVSGTYAVVGAYWSDPGGKTDVGAAYVFERNSGTGAWEQKTKLVASDAMTNDYFGWSVSVSGTYAIVGAYSRTQLGVVNSGGAYVFERNSGSTVWEQKAVLFPSDLSTGTRFGFSVSISGTYAIAGAYIKSGGGGAYVYERNSGTGAWEEKAILAMSDTTTGAFGYSVSIDGTYAVVGAYTKTVSSLGVAGGAYVFERVSGTWTQMAILDNPDPVASDGFGISVAVNGVYAVIGCYGKDPASKSSAGSTYLYKRNSTSGAWENKIEWTASDGLSSDTMGYSVGISGTHVFSGTISKAVTGVSGAGGVYVYELPSGTVPPSSVTITAPSTMASTDMATVTIGTLGTDATYTYVVSYSTTNSSTATMVDCGTVVAQTASQSVALYGLSGATTYYLWVRSKVTSSSAYTVLSSSAAVTTSATWPPLGGTIVVSAITQLTCTATVTMTTLGTSGAYDYFLSGSPTNDTGGTMTDWVPMTRQTASQALAVSGLSANTTQYLFLRARSVADGSYAFITTTGVSLTTTAGVAPSGGTVGTPSSVTSISATVAVTMTTLGTDSTYNYFLSSSPTNSTGGTMTNLISLTAQTASQNASLTLLAPSTTSYLFCRAQNVVTGAYIFMTTVGTTLTTLGTGNAPTGSTVAITSAASTTAVVAVTMTTLGTNANYVYYLSWCATNSVGGTMGNVCLLKAQTASQTVYPSGLPAGTSPYLFVRAKNVLTGTYTVMSASGTQITMSAASNYYEAGAITAFDPVTTDLFGSSVAVSGTYALVGTYQRDPLALSAAGSVYVMELNGTTGEWEHKAVLFPTDAYTSDYFGASVAVSGTYAVVGANQANPGGKLHAGAAYVFERNSGTNVWEQKTKLVASDAMPSDSFGQCVSVSGTCAIIGGWTRARLGVANSGLAYVFERNSGSTVWEQKASLFPSDLPTGSRFGLNVSVSGTYAIVGASVKTGGGGVYIYERNADTGVWEEKAILTCSDSTAANFGRGVSIDGTCAVVGAYTKTVSSVTNAGGAYVFERISGTWTQTAILDNPDPVASDVFGYSVAVSGVYAVIGCYAKDPASKSNAGTAYLYQRNSTTGAWENKMEWSASDGLAGDSMGVSVGISGSHVFAGAMSKSVTGISSAGGAYMYELPSGSTVPPSSATISATSSLTDTGIATVAIGTLGTDATYTYVISYSTTNSSAATMVDCGTCVAQTASQTVVLSGLTGATAYYLWVRAKVTSSSAYIVLSSSAVLTTASWSTSGGTIVLSSITPLTCTATVTITTLGAAAAYDYYLSGSPTNSTSGTMTDLILMNAQTASQALPLSGLSPSTTQYLFLRTRSVADGSYSFITTTGVVLTTLAGVAPAGGAISVDTSLITSTSCTAAVAIGLLGTDSTYNYFVSSSSTNSTGGTMTNLSSASASTTLQYVALTLLAPSTTRYLFLRAQNVVTGTYTFLTTTGVTVTTLGTGSAPTGASVSVVSSAATTAVVAVTMTTLGTNANYAYYLSWCATNSTSGTMGNACLLAAQTGAQTVYPSGLPGSSSPYLFVRAKNVLTGAYTVMSASGTQVTLSTPSWYYEAGAITAFDPFASDTFGISVAVSGSYAMIGAYQKDPLAMLSAGGAYVLELNGSTGEWEHKAVLCPTDAYVNDLFGQSVSVSGTYAVVGASSSDPGGKANAGAAYVFERNSGTGAWNQSTKLVAIDATPFDQFGNSISVSGTYAIVGSPIKYRLGVAGSGGAYVFERNSGSTVWEQKASLFPSDLVTGTRFGISVSVSGIYAIVGAYNKSGGGGAYVYERNSGTGTWEEKAILSMSDTTTGSFGYSVAIDGTYAVVSAYAKTVSSLTIAGGVYVFERVGSTWTQTAILDNPDPVASDTFGNSVAVSGTYLAIGCYGKDPASKSSAGSTYLYKRSSTTGAWGYVIQWTASDGLASDRMGASVGISGTHVFSGAYTKAVTGITSAGGAYAYEINAPHPPSGGSVATSSVTLTTATVTATIGVLGNDSTYSYFLSTSATNDANATMTDGASLAGQTTSQTATATGLTPSTTYYAWVRAKDTVTNAYLVISTGTAVTTLSPISYTGGATTIVAINGGSTGAIAAITLAGGTGTYTPTWSSSSGATTGLSGVGAKTGLKAGTYTLSVTDNATTPTTNSFAFVVAENPVISYTGGSVTDVLINGGSTGVIAALVPSGGSGTGFSFAWTGTYAVTNPTVNEDKTSLKAGSYSCVITDSVGATKTASFTVAQNPVITYTGAVGTNILINGGSTGQITAIVPSGGSGTGFTYEWTGTYAVSNPTVNETKTGMKAGSYTCVITDSVGGTKTVSVTLTENAVISYTGGAVTNVLINGGSTGQITALVPAGGSGTGFTVFWSGDYAVTSPTVNATKTGMKAGSYTCVITDSVGATKTASFTITENAVITYTGGVATDVLINGGSTGQISALVPAGGTGSFTYSWTGTYSVSSPTVNATKTGMKAGSYSCVITDTAGATKTVSVTIAENPVISYTGGAVTNVLVNGGATGVITALVPTGGSGTGYSYQWSGTYTVTNPTVNEDKTGLKAGTYSCVITDSVGATKTASITVTENAVITYTGGAVTNVLINGGSTGQITALVPAGGTGSYLFAWSGDYSVASPTVNATKTGLKAGAYTCVITDTAGATKTALFSISENPVITYTGGAVTNVLINGGSTGQITTLVPSGGSGTGFSVSWTGDYAVTSPTVNATKTGMKAGSYACVITDSVGATKTASFTITENAVISYTGGIATDVLINGGSTGQITALVPTGGTGSYTYSWSGTYSVSSPTVNATKTGMKAGSYSCIITDTAGATKTVSVTIAENPVISYTGGAVTNVLVNGGATGVITALVPTGGSGTGFTYEWTGTYAVSNPTVNEDKTGLKAGTYSCVITDSVGATKTASITVTENAVITYTGGAVTNVLINGGSTGQITALVPAGGTGSYLFAWSGDYSVASPTVNATKTGLKAGAYTCVITDTAGATKTALFSISENPVITYTGGAVTNVLINGGSTGQITALVPSGGSGTGYSVIWSGDYAVPSPTVNATKTGMKAGSYACVITDSVGATKTASFTITENDAITYTGGVATDVLIHGGSTGEISALVPAGGTGSYSFEWTGTYSVSSPTVNATKTGMKAGSYSCIITDTAGATKTVSVTIAENPVISYTGGVVTNVLVNGEATGVITALVPTGGSGSGYTYEWSGTYAVSNPTVNEDKTGLKAGSYSCLITDSVGATKTASVTVTENAVITYTGGAVTDVLINGGATGQITALVPVGGTGSYSYLWSGTYSVASPTVNATKTGLKAGAYSCVITDTAGATVTASFTVDEDAVISYTGGVVTDVLIYGQSTGQITTLVPAGGTGSYTFSWTGTYAVSNPTVNATKTGLKAGLYSCLITDTAGATKTATFTVAENAAITYTGGAVTDVLVHGGSTGVITALVPAGGAGSFSFAWSGSYTVANPTVNETKTGLKAGSYSCVITDSAGATTTASFTIAQNDVITCTGGAVTNVLINGGSTGQITALVPAGGTGAFYFAWSGTYAVTNSTVNETKTGLKAGSYSCLITDTAGATKTVSVTITENAAITCTGGSVTNVLINGGSTGQITALVPSGGTGSYSYQWSGDYSVSNPTVNATKTGLKAGAYSCLITDSAGATKTVSVTIAENAVITYTGGVVTNVSIYGQSTGQISAVTPSGGTGSYTYLWGSGIANSTVNATKTGLAAGTYSLVITDSAGATKSASFTVAQNAVISYTGGAITDVAVSGQSTGVITALSVSGGSGSYTYTWNGVSNPTVNETKTGLSAGSYAITITDSAGATKSATFVVGAPMTASATITSSSGSDGAISNVSVSGGVSPYAYAWTSNSTSVTSPSTLSSKTGLAPGTYTLTVTDSHVVSKAFAFAVTSGGISITPGSVTDNTAYGASAGAIGVSTVAGGASPYTYSWTSTYAVNEPTSNTAKTGLRAGTYTLAVTDSSQTSATYTFTVAEPTPSLAFDTTPVSLRATWQADPDADGYRVEYKVGTEYSIFNRYTKTNSALIPNLTSGTSYTVRISSIVGTALTVHVSGTVTLPAQVQSSFNKAAFLVPGSELPVYDATALNSAPISVTNALFNTGDVIQTHAESNTSGNQTVQAKMVKLHESIHIEKNSAVYMSFDTADTSAQEADLITSTGQSVPVVYSNASITINGVVYMPGDVFYLDGQRVSVCHT